MKINKKITAVIAVALIIVILVSAAFIRDSSRRKALEGSWYRIDSKLNGGYSYFLNISGKNADYVFSSRLLTTNLDEFTWKFKGSSQIVFKSSTIEKTVSYELINDNTGLVFTPALSNNKSSEVWYLYTEDEESEEEEE
ncbi:MAG: hypothetical protein LUC92_09840 [Clostridiales bacterium]|nr:hypothetical protein [Clostridiales bacterium]